MKFADYEKCGENIQNTSYDFDYYTADLCRYGRNNAFFITLSTPGI